MPGEAAAQFNIHDAKTNLSRLIEASVDCPSLLTMPSQQAGFRISIMIHSAGYSWPRPSARPSLW